MAKRQTDLENDKIGGLIIRLAVPSIAAQLVNALYNIVDRIYIGHIDVIGSTALTGVGVTFPLILIISAFSALIGMGGAPRAAQRFPRAAAAGTSPHPTPEARAGRSSSPSPGAPASTRRSRRRSRQTPE